MLSIGEISIVGEITNSNVSANDRHELILKKLQLRYMENGLQCDRARLQNVCKLVHVSRNADHLKKPNAKAYSARFIQLLIGEISVETKSLPINFCQKGGASEKVTHNRIYSCGSSHGQ